MTPQLTADFEKRFPGGFTLRFQVRRPAVHGSVTALFGPSGCGKTTALRCLAALERPENGAIALTDSVWFDAARGISLSPQARNVGFMFQDYVLFPHLTIARNIGYGLAGVPSSERHRRVSDLISRFGLDGLDRRYPHQLSGGQQQRVALARAVARKPALLLLDEPLSTLDGPTRAQTRVELRKLLHDADAPVILVTHDAIEAVTLADHVVVMDHGTVRQQGPVEEVFSRPADSTVARITGVETVLRGRVSQTNEGLADVAVGGSRIVVVGDVPAGCSVDLFIRAQDVALVRAPTHPGSVQNHFPARIQALVNEGALTRVLLDCGFPLTALITRRAAQELSLTEGDGIVASVKAAAIHLVPLGE